MAQDKELQTISAGHGVATFVPAGQTIKIINTSGTQVVDTWAFALPKPDGFKQDDGAEETKETKPTTAKKPATPKKPPTKKKNADNFPSQEEAEKSTQEMLKKGDKSAEEAKASGWSSYVPSLGFGGSTTKKEEPKDETEEQKNSRTWSSYFPIGQGFSSYIPKSATDTVTSFAKDHQRDPNKSYLEQLTDFSKTPVGATGYSGLAALTGSGYSGAAYAGYQAWNAKHAPNAPPMEYLSMEHSRTSTLHVIPRVNDTLVSNLREPMLTVIEDSSPGIHDTLIAACDPARYKALGVNEWAEHGSCAQNLVLALTELNERAGLKGAKGVGADCTINNHPAPLNLFMNVPWDDEGDLGFKAAKTSPGDYIRLKAERDVVVVMSACPQDLTDINGKKVRDAHFIVEEAGEDAGTALKRTQAPSKKPPATKRPVPKKSVVKRDDSESKPTPAPVKKKPVPKPIAPSKESATVNGSAAPVKKKPVPKPVAPSKKPAPATVNGTALAEKKKPRKLTPKPKVATAS
ncbi:Hypothetical protein R9X50_00295700 [Acrodontium crateriforme]|uniref:DUF1989 domain-containing protein n=1 Tax=Acrodontium crateriforme TaxID=150365 RepID=A0AAQ3R730_9PEZI|nr:Hypothetical protein R9X50_00295700 [Acrodontium crateriforme]